MERIKIRTQSLLTLMVAQISWVDLSANKTKGACVLPSRPRPACRPNRPDTYQRLPISSKFPLANSSRSIHWVKSRLFATTPESGSFSASRKESINDPEWTFQLAPDRVQTIKNGSSFDKREPRGRPVSPRHHLAVCHTGNYQVLCSRLSYSIKVTSHLIEADWRTAEAEKALRCRPVVTREWLQHWKWVEVRRNNYDRHKNIAAQKQRSKPIRKSSGTAP
jgi:hypothetical protein